MWDWLIFLGGAAVVAAVFVLLSRLIGRSQRGDPSQRGRDSSEPGGFYTDTPD